MDRSQNDNLTRAVAEGISRIGRDYLHGQRWYGAKSRAFVTASCIDIVPLDPDLFMAVARFEYADGPPDLYLLPLALWPTGSANAPTAFTVSTPQGEMEALDAVEDDRLAPLLYRTMAAGATLSAREGAFHFGHSDALAEVAAERPVEPARLVRRDQGQSNSSITYGSAFILKLFRRLEAGTNPDLEVLRFLTERSHFANIPRLAGWIEYRPRGGGEAISVGALQTFEENQGGAWEECVAGLEAFLRAAGETGGEPDRQALEQSAGRTLEEARVLGHVTGAMHVALASDMDDPDFRPEPISRADTTAWQEKFRGEIAETRDLVLRASPDLPERSRSAVEALFESPERLEDVAARLGELAGSGAVKLRQHGDYHLGQLLVRDGDFIILDFEGEPLRSLAERRAKHTPLKDVAGMLRSLSYAVAAGLFAAAGHDRAQEAALEPWADAWLDLARERFLGAYGSELARAPAGLLPNNREATERALGALELEKALYELRYELNNRPDWLRVPLRGIERTLEG